jgi:hypothetical protein
MYETKCPHVPVFSISAASYKHCDMLTEFDSKSCYQEATRTTSPIITSPGASRASPSFIRAGPCPCTYVGTMALLINVPGQ